MWNRTTRGLMLGTALAGFGGWIDFLAILTLAAYVYQASASLMALISAIFVLPSMLLGPRIGRWLDRSRPLPILLAALGLRTLSTGLLLLQAPVALFCGLLVLRALFNTPTESAANLLVARVVKTEDVPRYFSMLGVLRNASKIAAPVIGSTLASRFGEASALSASILLSLIALALLAAAFRGQAAIGPGTPKPVREAPVPASGAPVDENRDLLRTLLGTVTVFSFMVFLINNQLPVLLHKAGFDKALLGLLVSCSGAGGILAAAWLARRKRAAQAGPDPLRLTLFASGLVAVCFIGLGFAFRLPPALAPWFAGLLFFCTGLCASVQTIQSSVVVVQRFPQGVALASARMQAFQSGAMLIAPWVAALLIPHLSVSALFLLDGSVALLALLGVATWVGRRCAPVR
ncbi:MFS transporter [Uliginosibacterium paludis]|uniref:MFS transporter n=1 Tax=Uliginosibacterium paludis TaxID=1615952 RepID=A0ABV2CNM8_9RHOO